MVLPVHRGTEAGLLRTRRLVATGDRRVVDMVPAMDSVSPSVDSALLRLVSLVRRYTDDFCCFSTLLQLLP